MIRKLANQRRQRNLEVNQQSHLASISNEIRQLCREKMDIGLRYGYEEVPINWYSSILDSSRVQLYPGCLFFEGSYHGPKDTEYLRKALVYVDSSIGATGVMRVLVSQQIDDAGRTNGFVSLNVPPAGLVEVTDIKRFYLEDRSVFLERGRQAPTSISAPRLIAMSEEVVTVVSTFDALHLTGNQNF